MGKYADKAMEYFREGYNCAQAVALAFAEPCGLDETVALKLSSSFGGGMGRLREVCGAVSAMFMVAGLLHGYTSPTDRDGKAEHYAFIQSLAAKFKEKNGSIVCRELLSKPAGTDNPAPDERTAQYYKKRPCAELVGDAAEIIEEYLLKEEN